LIDTGFDSHRNIADATHAIGVEFTPRLFPWLGKNQNDNLVPLVGSDGQTAGLIGSCIERGSNLEEIANSLNPDESERENRMFTQAAKKYLSHLAGKENLSSANLHFVDPKPGCPPIKVAVNGKLRVFFVDVRLNNGMIAIVKIAACRKQNEDVVLREISSNPRANIR
jgi:hypothetical protein